MAPTKIARPAALLGAISFFCASPLLAQKRGVDFTYGRWWYGDERASAYTASLYRPFFGPFDIAFGVTHLDDSRSTTDRTQTGGEVSLGLGRPGSGLYLVAGTGLAMRHDDGNVDAHWSVGGGYSFGLLSFLSLGIEARYRVEDQEVRGFWRLDPTDRRGLLVQARVAIGSGRQAAHPARPEPAAPPAYNAPPESELRRAAYGEGLSEESAALAVDVVRTALDVMGTPYRWGGSDETGYDCSGLIHFAYEEHGLLLPRVSRDQARTGRLIERDVGTLRPADILGFSVDGNGVSHVALYVGEGKFIHSASAGVKLSSLAADDPESRWWRDRWVVARRILN